MKETGDECPYCFNTLVVFGKPRSWNDTTSWYLAIDENCDCCHHEGNHNLPIDYCPFCGTELAPRDSSDVGLKPVIS